MAYIVFSTGFSVIHRGTDPRWLFRFQGLEMSTKSLPRPPGPIPDDNPYRTLVTAFGAEAGRPGRDSRVHGPTFTVRGANGRVINGFGYRDPR